MTKKIYIFGQGVCADEVKRQLSEYGQPVVMAVPRGNRQTGLDSPQAARTERFIYDQLLDCTGSAGDFTLLANVKGTIVRKKAAAVILAGDGVRRPDFAVYGLTAGLSVMSLSALNRLALSDEALTEKLAGIRRIAFLTGLSREKTPAVCQEVLQVSLLLQSRYDVQTFIFTRNLKVAAWGLEALYRETKTAGTIYVKITQQPEITLEADGQAVITCRDDVTREFFRLQSDLTVVDETLSPLSELEELARVFQIDLDAGGFGQSDNVHRYPVATNRRGILSAGAARSALMAGKYDQMNDAANAAAAVARTVPVKPLYAADTAEIDSGQCVRCLTCYRLCPYRAVLLHDEQPVVDPQLCERCGICAAECPALAIRLPGFENTRVGEEIGASRPGSGQEAVNPFLVAFCCGRSAAPAGRLAACMGNQLPANVKIIEVPCAGSVAREFILEAFGSGADGVMVLTCHAGNCHSERGNRHAQARTVEIQALLPLVGIEPERLVTATFASNMGVEFAQFVGDFITRMSKLEPRHKRNG